MTLRLPDSGAGVTPDGRRHAPSAERNAGAILSVLRAVLPERGRMLEIAAGTGQHAAAFAAALPGWDWQATDADPTNLASIAAWAAQTGAPNLAPPVVLDAARSGWAADWPARDAVLIVNLLHLIPEPAAETVLAEAATALAPGGCLCLYGPFLRDGQATSPGDAAFDASLRAQDPAIGYKDADWARARLAEAGLRVTCREMPANNLMWIAFKP
jgi:SAM-dependent methyltransferase